MSRMPLSLCAILVFVGLPGCARENPAPTGNEELPSLNVTHWTDKTELFMEYPPLVAGETALFAVHLTRLSDFSAMTAGRPRIASLIRRQ